MKENKILPLSISKRLQVNLYIWCLLFFSFSMQAQYEKNPLVPIENENYEMVVEKFVQIPDDDGNRPRINCLTFMNERVFVSTEVGGKIYEIIPDGEDSSTAVLFFNVKDAILSNTGRNLITDGNWHAGLRSVAFHHDFMSNGKFYVSVMEERPADTSGHHYLSDVEEPIESDGVVIEWTYDLENDTVETDSYREVLRVGVPFLDHTIKQIMFNPHALPEDEDYGLLYVNHGDGNPYYAPANGGLNNDGRGKILRIDPLQTGDDPYSIPPTNPFVGDPDWLDEIYAIGMRNPHNSCFAKDAYGNVLLINANVGRDNIEEVNLVTAGENYGWSAREGTYVQLPGGGLDTGLNALPDTEADSGYTYPAAQWSRKDAVFAGINSFSIAGGYIYYVEETDERLYISADFPRSGIVMYNRLDDLLNAVTKLDPSDAEKDEPEELTQATFYVLNVFFNEDGDTETPPLPKSHMFDVINDDANYDGSNRSDLRFGRDQAGKIYISSKRNGWVYKIQSISPPADMPDAIEESLTNNHEDIILYPNPVSRNGTLHIRLNDPLPENAQIYVYDLQGKLIMQNLLKKGNVEYNLNLEKAVITQNLYFVKIVSNQTIYNFTITLK